MEPFYDLYAASETPPAVVPGAVPFGRLMAELKEIYGPGLAAPMTWGKVRGVLTEVKALGVLSTDELTLPLVARYISSRPPSQSPYTLWSVLSSLRAVCSYAESMGYVRISPFRIKKLAKWCRRPSTQQEPHLSRDDIRRVLDLMRRDIDERTEWAQWRARRGFVVASIIAYAALRKTECLRLYVSDCDLPGRVIHVVPRTRLKTDAASAPVPLADALVPIIEAWLSHRLDGPPGVIVPDCVWLIPNANRLTPWLHGPPGGRALNVLQNAAERAGVKGMSFQALRVAWATHAEYFGLGPALIQRVLRHTSTRTSETYYRRADLPNLIEKVAGMTF